MRKLPTRIDPFDPPDVVQAQSAKSIAPEKILFTECLMSDVFVEQNAANAEINKLQADLAAAR